jgi:hypothetical protein|tara:strand:+ start:4857 stop:5528 length:672 start_codon:yes stop_codon:yes gene_type:complete
MKVSEIITLFKQFANESDTTFLTAADIGTYLSQGYREFRELVTELSPEIYQESQVYSLSSVSELDLATSTPALLNPTGGTIMTNLLHVVMTSDAAGNDEIEYLDGGASQSSSPYFGYALEGTKLRFGGNRSGTMRIDFVRDHGVEFDSAAVGYDGNAIPDILVAYHPLIALYAYRYYAIRDGDLPQDLQLQIGNLTNRLHGHLSGGRDPGGSTYVNFYNADRF